MIERARRGALPVALLLSAALAGCSGDDSAGIRVERVTRSTVAEVVEAPATVTARASATVHAAATGSVAALLVREGERVRPGQVLLRVESPSARRALRQARRADAEVVAASGGVAPVTLAGAAAADATAQQSFAQARRSARAIADPATRAQALAALRVSQAQYAAARAQAQRTAAQLAAGLGSLSDAVAALSSAQRVQTRAALDAARRTVAALTVRAPIAGSVSLNPAPSGGGDAGGLLDQLPESLRAQAGAALGSGTGSAGSTGSTGSTVTATVAEGAPVSSGQPLVTLTDSSSLTLTAQVDETDVLLVRPGVPAGVELDAVPDARYEATVTSIDPAPTTSSRGGVSYVVRLTLGRGTSPDGSAAPAPRPGMSAVVDLRVRTVRSAVAVPASAVLRIGRRDAVWVVKNDVVEQRVVRLGAQGRSRVEVVEGLQPGERVVVRGADRVRDGQRL